MKTLQVESFAFQGIFIHITQQKESLQIKITSISKTIPPTQITFQDYAAKKLGGSTSKSII